MKDFVLDASVALGWLIDEPSSRYSKRVQQLMLGGARAAGSRSLAFGDC